MAENSSHTYELIYILDSVLDEKGLKDMVDRVNKFIGKNDGKVLQVDEWGIRHLEYPIRKKTSGYFVNLYFTAPAEIAAPFDRALRINEHIMRYMVLKLDAKMLRHYEKTKGTPAAIGQKSEAEEAIAGLK